MAKLKFVDLVVHEDDNFFFILKPAGISTLEDRFSRSNILQMAREVNPDLQVCHRLDKDTSGLLVIAKNPGAYKYLSGLFEKRKVTKKYHAVVEGLHDFDNTQNTRPLHHTGRGKSKASRWGKESTTYFTTLDVFRMHTLVECRPITGRTHQIRAHLQTMGAPIVGDHEYGGKDLYLSQLKKNYNLKKFTEELPLIKRMALHAYSIEFQGIDGNKQHVEAPYPKDFSVLLKSLKKYV